MIWAALLILAALVSLALLLPLRSRLAHSPGRSDKALVIYKDQLAEIDRDADRGLISPDEARAAQVEIKRRMLALGTAETTPDAGRGRVGIFVAALFVPLAAVALYSQIGSPDVPGLTFAERGDEHEDARQLEQLTLELRKRLESEPGGGETRGWRLLAQTYMNMGRTEEAVEAFAVLTERDDATSATFSQYAEALIRAESGVVTPTAMEAINKAEQLDSTNPAATFYRAVALEQRGEVEEARQILLDRIEQESEMQPWMETFLNTANQMGASIDIAPVGQPEFSAPRGPTAEDVEAANAMSDEEQQDFIRNMVDSLAERMKDEPENLDGWLQLARAHAVLGEEEQALNALRKAKPLVAGLAADNPQRLFVEDGLKQLKGSN